MNEEHKVKRKKKPISLKIYKYITVQYYVLVKYNTITDILNTFIIKF